MATNEERLASYAEWIVANKDKQGSQEFETVANAYKDLRQQKPSFLIPPTVSEVPSEAPTAPTEEDTSIFGYIPETAKAIASGAAGLVESAATGASFLLPEEQEQAARRKISEVGERVQESLAPDEAYDGWYLDLMRGVGSTLPFFAAAATAPISAPLALVSGTAMGVGAGAGEAAQRAEAAGATEEEISKAAGLGMLPGALEMVGPAGVIRRARRVLGGNTDEVVDALDNTLRSRLKRVYDTSGGRVARAAFDEAVQETVSEVGQNLIQRGIYDPERGVFTDTGEAAALGGGVGGLLATLTEIVTGASKARRRAGIPEAEPEPEQAPTPTPTAPTPSPDGDLFGREEEPTVLANEDLEALGLNLDRSTAKKLSGLDLSVPEQQEEARKLLTSYKNSERVKTLKPETISRIDSLLSSQIFEAPATEAAPTVPDEQVTIEDQIALDETAQESELESVEGRVKAAQIRQTEENRREVLLPIVEESGIPDAENMARAFSAELGRQGFTDTTPTESELQLINSAIGVQEAVTTQEQEQEAEVRAAEEAREAVAQATEAEQRAGAAAIEQFVPEKREPTPPAEPVEAEPELPAGLTNRERLDRTGRIPRSGGAQLEIPTIERPEQAVRRLDIPEGAVVSPLPEAEEAQIPEEQVAAVGPKGGITREGLQATRRTQPQQNLTDLNTLQNVTIPAKKPKGTSVGYAMAHYVQNTTDFDQALRSIAFELVTPEKAKSLSINYKNQQRRANQAKQWVKNNSTPETFKLLEDYTAQERLKEKQRVDKDADRAEAEAQVEDYNKTEIESVTDADYTDFLSEEVVNEFAQSSEVDEFLTKNAVAASMGTVSAEVENSLFDNNIDSALSQLANSTPNADVKRTANKLAAAIKDLGITVEFVDGGIVNQKGDIAVAAYNPNTKTISFDIDSDTSVHAVLHESAHAVLHEIIKNKSHPVTKALTKLFNNVANRLPTAYGTQSLSDFVTETFVNPEFQALLAAHKVTGEKITAWRKFVNAVSRFLGLSTKPITVADAASAYVDMILGTDIDTRTATQINQAIAEGDTDKALNLMLGGKRFVSNKTLDETRTGFLANANRFTSKQSVNFLNGIGLQAIVDLARKGPKEYSESIDSIQEIFGQVDGIRNEEMKKFTGVINDAKQAFKIGLFREDSKNIAIANELVANMTLEGIDAFIPENEEVYSKNALTYGKRLADGKFEKVTEYFDTVAKLDAKEREIRDERGRRAKEQSESQNSR